MDITARLLKLDPSLERHNEGAWNKPFDPKSDSFSSFNDAGIEVETGEFLYAFVRMLKPERVLETGTHWGIGASYIGMALKDNNKGQLDTIEFLPEIHKIAKERIIKLGLEPQVLCHFGDVKDYNPTPLVQYKLILLDTEPQTRFGELIKFYHNLEDGGFIFIHDLHRHMHQIPNEEHGFAWPYGKIPLEMRVLLREGKLRAFHFDTPRGLTGFYKVHPTDYDWNTKD